MTALPDRTDRRAEVFRLLDEFGEGEYLRGFLAGRAEAARPVTGEPREPLDGYVVYANEHGSHLLASTLQAVLDNYEKGRFRVEPVGLRVPPGKTEGTT